MNLCSESVKTNVQIKTICEQRPIFHSPMGGLYRQVGLCNILLVRRSFWYSFVLCCLILTHLGSIIPFLWMKADFCRDHEDLRSLAQYIVFSMLVYIQYIFIL